MSKVDSTPENKIRHKEFTDAFVQAFEAKFAIEYRHQGGKDGSPLKAFLMTAPDVTKEQFISVVTSCWGSNDPWLKSISSICDLCDRWNRAVVRFPQNRKQSEGGDW